MNLANNVTDRINLVYEDHKNQQVELPLRLLVLSDLSGDLRSQDMGQCELINVENGIDQLMGAMNVSLGLTLPNLLNPASQDAIELNISFYCVDDFEPEHLLMATPYLTQAYQLYRQLGDESVRNNQLFELLADYAFTVPDVLDYTQRLVLQQELHERINNQLNLIIQHDKFRALESSWRSLSFLEAFIDYKENIELIVANVSKQALMEDFEDSPDVAQSCLFDLVYAAEFGQFGGRPYTLMIGDYDFTSRAQDIALLSSVSKIAAMSHCPFISAASGHLFGVDNFSDFSRIRDINAHFDQPNYAKWNSFRETQDSRYVCLTLPRFLLRSSYRLSGEGFEFNENASKQKIGLWGNSAFALATRFINSFSQYRWFVNVTGEEYGLLDEIRMHPSQTQLGTLIPTEVLISERSTNELINNGFTPLSIHKRTGRAGFTAIPSCHAMAFNEQDKHALLNQKLVTQIPYLLISCRFSQYIKVMQRENIGSWLTRSQIDQSINRWLKQYVSDMDNPAPAVRSRRPLRNASVTVRDMEEKAGWFLSSISITPHFKFMGQSFTLTERGRLEKA
ncbi:type VI secretion system contractile sheath large subunit [Pseudomonas sp. HK3]